MGLSFFQQLTGSGSLGLRNKEFQASFSLTIAPDCTVGIINLMTTDHRTARELAFGDPPSPHTGDDISMTGTTENGYRVNCAQARRGQLSCSLEEDPVTVRLLATPRTRIIVEHEDLCANEGRRVTFGMTNLEMEVHETLLFRLGSFDVYARAVPQHDELIRQIKEGEIPRAVTYEFMTDVNSISELSDLETKIYRLALMLSVLKLNDIKPFYSTVQNKQGAIVSATLYTDLRESRFIRFFKMIDDEHIHKGTEVCVNDCYETFRRIHDEMNFHPFIFDLLFAARTPELHVGIVVLVLGLEYLVTHYGRNFLHWPEDREGNLVQKLAWLNREIRCIPKKYLKQKFISEIRNPLIHTGIIVNVPSSELVDTLYDLYRLSALVFLRLVGYSGQYLDFSWPPRLVQMGSEVKKY
jgi:hypothetical protein